MRKRRKGRKLSRKKEQREALIKSLASSLLLRGKIKTNLAKAKEVSVFVQKQITKAKKGGLSNKRMLRKVFSEQVVKKLFNEIALKYKERKGGYVRIIKAGIRNKDNAEMAIIELV